jgi:hypothetical protein
VAVEEAFHGLSHSRQHIKIVPGAHQKRLLTGAKSTAAQLVKRAGKYFLHIQINAEAPKPIDPDDYIGVCGPTTHRAAFTDNASRGLPLSQPTTHREGW